VSGLERPENIMCRLRLFYECSDGTMGFIRITFKKESLLGEKLIINGRREDRIISFDILNDKTLLSRIRFEFK